MTAEGRSPDRLAALYPPQAEQLPIAWYQVRIPGPPAVFALNERERRADAHAAPYYRRTIHNLPVPDTAPAPPEHLSLIDKAIPHAQFDLMCTELSPGKSTLADIAPRTARLAWCSAYNFVRFVSRRDVQRRFGLAGGQLHLALNCDPNTLDRESCQANKHFHLHFLYWTAAELAGLARPDVLADLPDPFLRRRVLDPVIFLGARVLHESLAGLNWDDPSVQLLPLAPEDAIRDGRPLGCVLRLTHWRVLDTEAFARLLPRIHLRIVETCAGLQQAFTGRTDPPPPWRRHALLPSAQILDNLERLGLSSSALIGLRYLARWLRDVPERWMPFLRRHPQLRMHHLALNTPSYALNIFSPQSNSLEAPLVDAPEIFLTLQPRLFSAIGGAGQLYLSGVPSVRILRGQGRFDEAQWRTRTRFQSAFARYNRSHIAASAGRDLPQVNRFRGLPDGWSQA